MTVTEFLAHKTLYSRVQPPLLLGFYLVMANGTFVLLKTLVHMEAGKI